MFMRFAGFLFFGLFILFGGVFWERSRVSAQVSSGGFQYNNITGQTTTLIRTGNGVLHTLCFNNPTATETVTIYDGTSASGGTKIGTITVPASPQLGCLVYDVAYGAGLTIVTATASSDITVSYR